MVFYAAPMEGITGYIYRNAHHHYYGGVDRYFTPFLTPKKKKGMTSREKNDILPEHNEGIKIVPQIMTRDPLDFVTMAERICDYGYEEVNFNLGCPSGTVVSKGKGCGFLARPDELDRFFDQVFTSLDSSGIKISVKTRLGVEDEKEILSLMNIYNRYPIAELTIHARILKDYYREPVRLDPFREGLSKSLHPVCYNGDLYTKEDILKFHELFPTVEKVMIGRGMLRNPEIFEGNDERDYYRLQMFLQELCDRYEIVMSGDRNTLFKLKEIWSYLEIGHPDLEDYRKRIKKAKTLSEYRIYVDELFRSLS